MFESFLRDHRNKIVSIVVNADRKEQRDDHSIVILERDALENLMKLRDDVKEVIALKDQNKLQEVLKENKIAIKILSKLYKDKHMLTVRANDICKDLKRELKILHKVLAQDIRTHDIAKELNSAFKKVHTLLLQTEAVFNEHLGNIKSQLLPEHGKPEVNFVASQRKVSVVDDINTLGLWIQRYSEFSKQLLDIMHRDNGKLIDILNNKLADLKNKAA